MAVGSGIAIAWMDSRPGFDATGVTVVSLVVAAGLAVVIASARSLPFAGLLGVLVGIWVPILELGGSAGGAPLAALVFSVAGALGGAAAARMLGD
jgi:hypothetical protein